MGWCMETRSEEASLLLKASEIVDDNDNRAVWPCNRRVRYDCKGGGTMGTYVSFWSMKGSAREVPL